MGKPEAKIENFLRRRVKEEGGQIRKVRWIGRKGAADNLIWWTFPRVALVECKAEGESIDWRSNQGREFRRMADADWPVFEVNSHEEVETVIEMVKKGVANPFCTCYKDRVSSKEEP